MCTTCKADREQKSSVQSYNCRLTLAKPIFLKQCATQKSLMFVVGQPCYRPYFFIPSFLPRSTRIQRGQELQRWSIRPAAAAMWLRQLKQCPADTWPVSTVESVSKVFDDWDFVSRLRKRRRSKRRRRNSRQIQERNSTKTWSHTFFLIADFNLEVGFV